MIAQYRGFPITHFFRIHHQDVCIQRKKSQQYKAERAESSVQLPAHPTSILCSELL